MSRCLWPAWFSYLFHMYFNKLVLFEDSHHYKTSSRTVFGVCFQSYFYFALTPDPRNPNPFFQVFISNFVVFIAFVRKLCAYIKFWLWEFSIRGPFRAQCRQNYHSGIPVCLQTLTQIVLFSFEKGTTQILFNICRCIYIYIFFFLLQTPSSGLVW